MSPFSTVPAVVGVLWLIHAFLAITGNRAYVWTRGILLAGLPLSAVSMVLLGGMMGLAFALTTILTWLVVGFLEVFLVMGTTIFRDTTARKSPVGP
ncbi:hypothetical protein [Pseudarthrobacter sp. AB1]|uniref:hypothetical protein n=1 Tax=Pseudarthrobacter sp. AB1 TaxID=2138309 RepID=UPI00186B5C75|nr:hypothetical protein [Pseudarthrobacter sp. AB1]MBE4719332.1 hypothetical protein [Pseudarthrobacter sp. AB1]